MKTSKTIRLAMLVVMLCIGIDTNAQMNMDKKAESKVTKAICVLYSTSGSNVSGTLKFIQTDRGIQITTDIKGLTEGKHGIHIHECGDCSAADASSAGGHFNPEGKMHGSPDVMSSHAGDLGNIVADKSGVAHLEYTDKMMSFEGVNSIIGRSVIIHKDEDDLKTQPAGNSGARVACGVIGISK
jgi:superoxide dismutase, Cu-Zn family